MPLAMLLMLVAKLKQVMGQLLYYYQKKSQFLIGTGMYGVDKSRTGLRGNDTDYLEYHEQHYRLLDDCCIHNLLNKTFEIYEVDF